MTTRRILIVGDSISTKPYQTSNQRGWTEILTDYGASRDWTIFVAAISGAQISALSQPMDAYVRDNLSDVIFFIGTNNVGAGQTLPQIQAQATPLYAQATTQRIPNIWIVSILPRDDAPNEAVRLAFNAWNKGAEIGANYIDAAEWVTDPTNAVQMRESFMADPVADRLHPNTAGSTLIAARVIDALEGPGSKIPNLGQWTTLVPRGITR